MMPLFVRPWWLLALLPLAVLAWRLWRAPLAAEAAWRRAVDAHLLPHLLTEVAPGARRNGIAILVAALALAVIALAGPTSGSQAQNALRRDALRVLAVDLSPAATPHLDRIRAKTSALLRALPEGETALLVYADEPYLVAPPTTDVQTIARFIPELAPDAMPAAGNQPARAAKMANTLLQRHGGARDLVWISAAAHAAMFPADPQGVRISLLLAGESGDTALADAAQRSGGVLVRMQDDDGDVRRLSTVLGRDGGWVADAAADGRTDIGYWLLPALLPLAALAFRRGVLMLAAPVLCAGLLAPPPAHAWSVSDYLAARLLAHSHAEAAATRFSDPDWRAVASYRAGRYEESARLLEGRNTPDAHYNRGNALAKLGRLTDALAAYEASLALRPNDADTVHNRDLVRRLLNQRDAGGNGNPPQDRQDAREAERIAEQWLRGVPDEPQSLLRRKLALEHRQRAAGKAERPW